MALTPTVRGADDIAKTEPSGHIAGTTRGELTEGSTTDTVVWRDGSGGAIVLQLIVTYTDSGKLTVSHWDWSQP